MYAPPYGLENIVFIVSSLPKGENAKIHRCSQAGVIVHKKQKQKQKNLFRNALILTTSHLSVLETINLSF